jgi:hypothetical protein
MKTVQFTLLGIGVIATLLLPIFLLGMAINELEKNGELHKANHALILVDPMLTSEIAKFRCEDQTARVEDRAPLTENQTLLRHNQTLTCENQTRADQYSAWSSSLVVLGPSLFMTSLLAMSSKRQLHERVLIGFAGFVPAVPIYWQLASIGEEFHIPVVLGIAGVLYCLVADIFTPDRAYESSAVTNALSFVTVMVLFLAGIVVLQYLTLDNVWPMAVSLVLLFLAFWISQSVMGHSDSVDEQAKQSG